jgi:hypothetical protein
VSTDIKEDVMRLFDRRVEDLSQSDYRDLLEEMVSEFDLRLECVNAEMAGGETDG